MVQVFELMNSCGRLGSSSWFLASGWLSPDLGVASWGSEPMGRRSFDFSLYPCCFDFPKWINNLLKCVWTPERYLWKIFVSSAPRSFEQQFWNVVQRNLDFQKCSWVILRQKPGSQVPMTLPGAILNKPTSCALTVPQKPGDQQGVRLTSPVPWINSQKPLSHKIWFPCQVYYWLNPQGRGAVLLHSFYLPPSYH